MTEKGVHDQDSRPPRYDPDLQMFTEPVHDADLLHLEFLRWLNQRSPLEMCLDHTGR